MLVGGGWWVFEGAPANRQKRIEENKVKYVIPTPYIPENQPVEPDAGFDAMELAIGGAVRSCGGSIVSLSVPHTVDWIKAGRVHPLRFSNYSTYSLYIIWG